MSPLRAVALLALTLLACGERPTFEPGDTCTLNSDCYEPYVCRLERCRSECARVRDCPIGSMCIQDADGLGSCRLPDEASCAGDEDCAAPLVCRSAACTNECTTNAECTVGSVCRVDEATGASGCFDPATVACDLDSDCEPGEACQADGRCRPECRTDRDCSDGLVCDAALDELGACVAP